MSMKNFLLEILDFNIKIPLAVRMGITITLLIIIIAIMFVYKNEFSSDNLFKNNYKWWCIVAIFNLLSISIIMYYYENKEIEGVPGAKGKRGDKGDRGKFITCSFCADNLFVKKTKKYNTIVDLSKSVLTDEQNDEMFESYNKIIKKYNEHNIRLDKLDLYEKNYTDTVQSINSIINNISHSTDKLVYTTQFMVKLCIKEINKIISGGNSQYPGSFHNVIGSFPIGDTVFSNDTKARKLNAFMVDGDVRHPIDFTHRTTFYEYKINQYGFRDAVEYTVWKPNAPENYQSLGDIVVKGHKMPRPNIMACLNKKCLEPMSIKELELVFVYHGIDKQAQRKMQRGDSMYSVKININDMINSFRLYSVWRTPLNTMYVKTTNNSDLENDSVLSNILGNANHYRDKFGLIKRVSYSYAKTVLLGYQLPIAIRRLFILGYYSEYYLSQLEKHKNNFIDSKYYNDYIRELDQLKRKYNAEVISKSEYDKEVKYLNEQVLKEKYNLIKNNYLDKIKQIDEIVKKKKSLYDILTTIIPGGFYAQIYVNESEENSANGIELTLLQKQIIVLCKVLFPPNRIPYMIKNECLSFIRISKKRRELVRRLGKVIRDINYRFKLFTGEKTVDDINDDGDDGSGNETNSIKKYCEENRESVYKYMNMVMEYLQRYTAHIKDGVNKLFRGDYDDFTDSRLEEIVNKLEEFRSYFDKQCS